ncbi:hypothetical protein [Mesobacillus stamsii]|uniref:Uncharacterized protein n=1 Tax=Mesobacillus stamsii TaxID=225347 RepID=A0ABU0FWB6_9BACI|nr:hypothetical protein [Mesobacillus stamsii]MDQ0414208.1 hypothetical protein [Mesobacillus stamsii]
MDEKPVVINIPAVETWNITALRHACKKNKIKGYSKMTQEQLIAEVNKIIFRLSEKVEK